ncbi:MAG: hypothetical protein HQ517_03315 [SAR324 cluster bacterium]|nr:hypothetical protein [SAR324 cluster bacterium]
MRTFKKLLAAGIVVGLFIVLLNVSIAGEGDQPTRPTRPTTVRRPVRDDLFGGGAPRREVPPMMPSRRVGIGKSIVRLKNQFDLTEDQVVELEQVEATDPNEIMKLYQVTREINLEINKAVMRADEVKIKELSAKLGKATEAQSLFRAKEYAVVKKILTKEQYDKYLEFSEQGPGARRTAAPARTPVQGQRPERQPGGGGIRPPTPLD